MKTECVETIQAFWKDGILTSGAARGIIRLIPKLRELEYLENWRPITMLSLLYKLISEILALRLQPFMPFLVDLE